ncbi:hypothetical protein CK203_092738 [Vitis vinifera]|uniref:Aspartic peptidase DDI1-type domain-containing protein n=1 Tax=Vitis vinifera TaxID=29760 RepID=A0A438D874_VITVI|nr:hypothetical protein CK203_092738 [Vitis vinifera]
MRRLDDLEAKGVQEVQIVNEGGHTSNILAILHIPTLIIRVGGIIQIYHGDEVIMANFNSKETDFRVIKLMGNKVFNHKILEVLRQVKINIPLLDMIKQVPAYAKFLKDLCTVKRRIKLSKKAFLTEQVSAIIENKAMVKYKDPGCPTISVQIGDSYVERALLDLGASLNLLPYSIYKKLGLGELKATTITLSLAYHSIKVPRRVVKEVLVQVEKFYYPVDFVVLDTEPLKKGVNSVPIILGRPFLATTNALINYRNGLMQISFGNMTVEMNVFNLCKQPMDHDDEENEEACLIEALV